MAIGSDACVSGNTNVVPELVVSHYRAYRTGDLNLARELQALLDATHQAMGSGGDLSLFKAMLAKRGLAVGCVRKPLVQANPAAIEQCWEKLVALGISIDPL
jgi:4-hydroxy-tetrahydrodipicolinate synthase